MVETNKHIIRVDRKPIVSSDLHRPREYTCPLEELEDHIVHTHLSLKGILNSGIIHFDVDVAAYRGFTLDKTAERIYELMSEDRESIQWTKIDDHGLEDRMTVDSYLGILAKNLQYMEHQGVVSVDWDRAKELFPAARDVRITLEDVRDRAVFTPDSRYKPL